MKQLANSTNSLHRKAMSVTIQGLLSSKILFDAMVCSFVPNFALLCIACTIILTNSKFCFTKAERLGIVHQHVTNGSWMSSAALLGVSHKLYHWASACARAQ